MFVIHRFSLALISQRFNNCLNLRLFSGYATKRNQMGGNTSQQKNMTPQLQPVNPFLNQPPPPVQIQQPNVMSQRGDLNRDIESSFYGGVAPTPTPTTRPWWASLLGQ